MSIDEGEDEIRLIEMTVFLKSGDGITVVNHEDQIREAAEMLLPPDSEYDGGDFAVEIRGIRLFPVPAPIVVMVQPWNVSAVTLVEVTGSAIKSLASRISGGWDDNEGTIR